MSTPSFCDNGDVVCGTAKLFGRQFLSMGVDNVLCVASNLNGVSMGKRTKYERGFAAAG